MGNGTKSSSKSFWGDQRYFSCYERYFLEVDVQYIEKLHDLDNDLPFLPEKIKIGKVEGL